MTEANEVVARGRGSPPRVALISSSYHPYFGGVEEHVFRVARCFREAAIPVEVWTVDRGENLGEQLVDGVRVRYLPTPLPARRVASLVRYAVEGPAARRQWRRAHAEFRPDILHVQCFGPNGIYALKLHDTTGTRLAVSGHGETLGDDDGVYRTSLLLRRKLTQAIEKSSFVSAPSAYALSDLHANFGLDGGQVVPNGVDLAIRPDRRAARLDEEPYILGVGRLGRVKGFDLLIKAYAISGLGESHRLLIAGDGPELHNLVDAARGLGVADRVRFVGRLDAQEVANAMAFARVVTVPSRFESFGIVALEAWRSRTALIMTANGGGPEFVRDGIDGILVDPLDTAALARKLRQVVLDAGLRDRLADGGHERVAEYSWQHVADEYLRLYSA